MCRIFNSRQAEEAFAKVSKKTTGVSVKELPAAFTRLARRVIRPAVLRLVRAVANL